MPLAAPVTQRLCALPSALRSPTVIARCACLRVSVPQPPLRGTRCTGAMSRGSLGAATATVLRPAWPGLYRLAGALARDARDVRTRTSTVRRPSLLVLRSATEPLRLDPPGSAIQTDPWIWRRNIVYEYGYGTVSLSGLRARVDPRAPQDAGQMRLRGPARDRVCAVHPPR